MRKLILFLMIPFSVFAQDIKPHKTNYFAAGEDIIKFQVSLESEIFYGSHFGYTQKSFWTIKEVSSPFKESDYNPEVFYPISIQDSVLTIGHEHESTGVAGDNSRSWERTFTDLKWRFVQIRVWHAWPYYLHENFDLVDYAGNHMIALKLESKVSAKASFWKNAVQIEAFFDAGDFQLYVQRFSGFAESMVDYDKHTDSFYFGISLKI